MKVNTLKQWLSVTTLAVALTACSQTPVREAPVDEALLAENTAFQEGVVRYTVKPGDLLSGIAQEFTGDGLNWRAIADFNGISDPRRLRDGTVLEIPNSLIPGYNPDEPLAALPFAEAALARADERHQAALAHNRAAAAESQAAEVVPAAVETEAAADEAAANVPAEPEVADEVAETAEVTEIAEVAESAEATEISELAESAEATEIAEVADTLNDGSEEAAVLTESSEPVTVALPGTETAEVQLSAVSTPAPEAVGVSTLPDTDDEGEAGGLRSIRVIGTYYPKGIYAEPAASSALLMRVAPGTEFALDRTVNNWYRVTTDNGTGWIRASDARIIQ